MTDANTPVTPRGFSKMDANRSFIMMIALFLAACVGYWFCLPVLQLLTIPKGSGGKEGDWVLRPDSSFRFCAMAVLACVTIPIISRPLRRKWLAEDAASGSQYDPFHGEWMPRVVLFVKAFLLLIVYASGMLFYLLSWTVIGPSGIEEHLPWTTRKYSFQDIAHLEFIPDNGRTTSWSSKGGPWFDVKFKSGRIITLSQDNEGCTRAELDSIAAFISDRSGLEWQRPSEWMAK